MEVQSSKFCYSGIADGALILTSSAAFQTTHDAQSVLDAKRREQVGVNIVRTHSKSANQNRDHCDGSFNS